MNSPNEQRHSIEARALEPAQTPRNGRLWLICLATSFVLFAGALSVITCTFESGDDAAMMQIASGATTGEPSERLVFTNVLIGEFLKRLYTWNDDGDWYSIYLLTVHFVSTTAIFYALARTTRSRLAFLAGTLMFAIFEIRMLLEFQFTSTAMLAGGAGILLIWCEIANDARRPTVAMVLGVLLVVLSAMIRVQAFQFAMLIAAPLLAIDFWRRMRDSGLLHATLRYVTFAIAVLLSFGMMTYDRWTYDRDPGWKSFRNLQFYRATLYDFPAVDYAPNARMFFHRVGWSLNDFNMFRNYYLADETIANETSFRSLQTNFGQVARTPLSAREHRDQYLWELRPYLAIGVLHALIAIALARGARLRTTILAALVWGLLWGIFFYFSIYAKIASRVIVPAVYCASAVIFVAALTWRDRSRDVEFTSSEGHFLRAARFIALLLVTVAYGQFAFEATVSHRARNLANVTHRIGFDHLSTRMARDFESRSEHPYFLAWGKAYPIAWCGPTWFRPDAARQLNTIGIGWNANSPLYYEQLRNAGIDNVYRAIYERPDVYSFGSHFDVENMSNYAWEHFGETIDTEIPQHYVYDLDGPIQPAHLRIRRMTRINPDDAQRSSINEESSLR